MLRSIVLVLCSALLFGCGETRVPRRSAVPVLVHQDAARFERHVRLLQQAGYETVGLRALLAHLRGEPVALPPRPFVLTVDGGRSRDVRAADEVLRSVGFHAVLFVDVGRVDAGAPGYLSWDELAALQRSGRWDIQLESGTGNFLIRYGRADAAVGPFYAYRGEDEVLGGWRERVFGDVSWAERLLALRVPGYRPLAISPPYGNYGQTGTNDPSIPRLLLGRLHASFPLVFTQDRPALARRGQGTAAPVGRLPITRNHGERELLDLIN